ncbi:hypothetical protein T11_9550 [Trichinella zimbabwensis]|uniref:Uncharacterized protein n=1 Tax=Trichinella zimbabwensis TaxID=268475 RepID=A0A0V1I6H2_9BILA|nr:hypothetical protein T11_9550 [Trichinella zimbabwensis]
MPYNASLSRLVQACAYIAGARGQVTQLYLIAGRVVSAQRWPVSNRHLLEYINPMTCSCLQQAHIFSTKTGLFNTCILSTKGMPPSETGA